MRKSRADSINDTPDHFVYPWLWLTRVGELLHEEKRTQEARRRTQQ